MRRGGLCAGLMGDFKTAWVTLCSARSMFVAQVRSVNLLCFVTRRPVIVALFALKAVPFFTTNRHLSQVMLAACNLSGFGALLTTLEKAL